MRRRKTNTVTRRLRLHVGWVSLARMLGPRTTSSRPASIDDATIEGTALDNKVRPQEQPGGDGLTRSRRSQRSVASSPIDSTSLDAAESAPLANKNGSSGPKKNRPLTQLPGAASGFWCRVRWCGIRVASFEICPRTGLPLTPGECLLDLVRGRAWESCRLVLEVVATERSMQHPRLQEARERWAHLDQRGNQSNAHAGEGVTEVGEHSGSTPVEGGSCCLLGMVVIGWQVRDLSIRTEVFKKYAPPPDARTAL